MDARAPARGLFREKYVNSSNLNLALRGWDAEQEKGFFAGAKLLLYPLP